MLLFFLALLGVAHQALADNSTFSNPVLPGFSPDPSCVFAPKLDNTTVCVTSSFLTFPGLPISASRTLREWSLVSFALNREQQLPEFSTPNLETGGIWAPTIRYHDGVFYVITTLVLDSVPADNPSRWVNFVVSTNDPFCNECWSEATYFDIDGYDPDLFWDDDGQLYLTWSSLWQVKAGIHQATFDLKTGEVGQQSNIWNGTGGIAPEAPHIFKKDGYYYLIIAEGGTFLDHMETIARSKKIDGPYESNPANPILTNANTTEYFQAVGHADFFQDALDNWWGVAHGLRVNLNDRIFPMGRETSLFPLTWEEGEWPVLSQVRGKMSGWELAKVPSDLPGVLWDASEDINLVSNTTLPLRFVRWGSMGDISTHITEASGGLCLELSQTTLSSLSGSGNITGDTPFIGQRQSHTLFQVYTDVEFSPRKGYHEAGIALFLSENAHYQLGHIALPTPGSRQCGDLTHYVRLLERQGNATTIISTTEIPKAWLSEPIRLGVQANNHTHFTFTVAPTAHQSQVMTVGHGLAANLRPIFTGTLVGIYATTNGRLGEEVACFRSWSYSGIDQYINK